MISLFRPKGLIEQGEDIVEGRLGGDLVIFLDEILQPLDGNGQLGDVGTGWRLAKQALSVEALQLSHSSPPGVM